MLSSPSSKSASWSAATAPATSTDQLPGEQDRITSQIQETSEVIDLRTASLRAAEADAARLDERIRLINVAHLLAHHTVAIARNLPIPGLLILDGLSSKAGHEGYDRDRVRDVYFLLRDFALEYAEALQVIAVDNPFTRDLLLEMQEYLVLTLTQKDRLIRAAQD